MASRALRVGLLIGDRLVEERVFTRDEVVTFGQSLRCTLSLPLDGVPREQVLFDRGVLCRADGTRVEIAAGERGKLRWGDAIVLYQDIAAPPRVPAMRLPADMRVSLADRVDRRLAVIVGASLAVNLGIAAWAFYADVEQGDELAERQPLPTFHQDTIDVMIPDFQPAHPPAPGPGAAIPATPSHAPTLPVPARPSRPSRPVLPTAPERPVDPSELVAAFTNDTGGVHGRDETRPRRSSADLQKQIDDARDRGVTVGGPSHSPGVGPLHVGPGRDPIVDGPETPSVDPKGPEHGGGDPLPPARPGKPAVTTLTADMVLATIHERYQAGLQRCYQKGLRDDASLTGKIGLVLVVDGDGRVATASARGVSDGVDSCVDQVATGWSFPAPRAPDGTPARATFSVSLALQTN